MKTADELKISQAEYDALLKVRADIEANLLAQAEWDETEDDYLTPIKGNMFDMGDTCTSYECGTVGCIGGWMYLAMNSDVCAVKNGVTLIPEEVAELANGYVIHAPGALGRLFYPSRGGVYYKDFHAIKPSQALTAIDNFLNTGEANWYSILGDED